MNTKLEILASSLTGRIFLFSAVTLPALSNIQLALILLLGAFIADFLTGWLANYMEIKRGDKPMPPSGRSFESKKARESVVKGIGYILFILGAASLEMLFFDRKFEFTKLSSKSFGVTELVIGFCFVVEAYSTIVENLKRAGLDIVGKVGNMADATWKLINKIKGNG